IQRTILNEKGPIPEANPERAEPFTTKAAAPKESVLVGGKIKWRLIRPKAQFSDDLAGIPQDYRDALLRAGKEPWRAWARLKETLTGVHLVYTIAPVDTSGTAGVPTTLTFWPDEPKEPAKPLIHAELLAHYVEDIPTKDAAANVALSLRIDDSLF